MRGLLPILILLLNPALGCRSTTMRGELSGVSDLTSTTSEMAVLAFIGEVDGSQKAKLWRFFLIEGATLVLLEERTGAVFHYSVPKEHDASLWLVHPRTGQDWFVELRLPVNQRTWEVEAWTTPSRQRAESWGAVSSERLTPKPVLPPPLRPRILAKVTEELGKLRYGFSPRSTRAVLTQLRKMARELTVVTTGDRKLREALKDTAVFIKKHEDLYPVPVIQAWQDQDGKIETATLLYHEQKFLADWPKSLKRQAEFRVVKDQLIQLDTKLKDLDQISRSDSGLKPECKPDAELLSAADAKARFTLAKELRQGQRKLVFFSPERAQWQPYRVYKFEDKDEYVVLETPGSAHEFGAPTGRVAIGQKEYQSFERFSVTNYYRVDLGKQAFAAELDNSQTLLLKDGGDRLEQLYWDGQAISSRPAQRIPLTDFYEATGTSQPPRPSWCTFISGL